MLTGTRRASSFVSIFAWSGRLGQLDLGQSLLLKFFGGKGPLLCLTTVRSTVVRGLCSEVTYRTGLICGGRSFSAALGLVSASKAQFLEYRIVINPKYPKKADGLASGFEGFSLRLLRLALELRLQFFDLFECLFLNSASSFTNRDRNRLTFGQTGASPQPHLSASLARIIAGPSGFFTLIQSRDGPDR